MKNSKTASIELTELEKEKVHACLMLVAGNFASECYDKGIDITDAIAEEACRYRFYRELAKKFE